MIDNVKVDFSSIGRKKSYNTVLRHMLNVTDMVNRVGKGENLAEILNAALEEKKIMEDQILPLVSLILVQKYDYQYSAENLSMEFNDFEALVAMCQRWDSLDFVITYFHPNSKVCVLNPKKIGLWQEHVQSLHKNELLVVYVQNKRKDKELNQRALKILFDFFNGQDIKELDVDITSRVTDSATRETPKKSEGDPASVAVLTGKKVSTQTAPAAPKQKKNLTPQYSVQVTNELFHNGNVEAWKNIIASYQDRYPSCRVLVYHEGELIQDLNALFKWGKVKHGGVLLFQVLGEDISDVRRLQKYLFEGASSRYEAFLKQDIYRHLNLF